MPKRKPRPWILWLPKPIHSNPLGMAVAVLFCLVGVNYVITGGSESSIGRLLDSPLWVRIWAVSLILSCITLGLGIARLDILLEKLGCKLMAMSTFLFGFWVTLSVGTRGIATIVLCLLLIFFLQLRVGVINQLLHPWVPPPAVRRVIEGGGEDES